MNSLWYVFTGVLHGPGELVGRTLHDLVQDAGYIFVPAQISSSARYLIFDFSRCPGVCRYHSFGYSWIYIFCRIPKGSLGRYLAYVRTQQNNWNYWEIYTYWHVALDNWRWIIKRKPSGILLGEKTNVRRLGKKYLMEGGTLLTEVWMTRFFNPRYTVP